MRPWTPIADHLAWLLAEHPPAADADLAISEQALLGELGELLVYDIAPELLSR